MQLHIHVWQCPNPFFPGIRREKSSTSFAVELQTTNKQPSTEVENSHSLPQIEVQFCFTSTETKWTIRTTIRTTTPTFTQLLSSAQIELDGQLLNYTQNTKFLGEYITTKLNWRLHIENLINKATKRLIVLKRVSTQSWSQDTKMLLHLCISLVRSKLIYGQEVYFSAPNTLLKKLQSIDSKAIKLAIGVPVHTNISRSYGEAGMISLSEQRKLAISKYVIRGLTVTEEIFIDSNKGYPKSAQNISIQPIRNYINDLINESNIDIKSIPVPPTSPHMPQWEHINVKFDTDYTDLKKSESTNILAIQVRKHLNNTYQNHIKIFADGSVLDSLDSGAGFVIPELKVQKSFYLGFFHIYI